MLSVQWLVVCKVVNGGMPSKPIYQSLPIWCCKCAKFCNLGTMATLGLGLFRVDYGMFVLC